MGDDFAKEIWTGGRLDKIFRFISENDKHESTLRVGSLDFNFEKLANLKNASIDT